MARLDANARECARSILARAGAACCAAGMAYCAGPARAQDVRIAVFPFELMDTSVEGSVAGESADQSKRLELISAQLERMLKAGGLVPVDLAPVRDRFAKLSPIRNCNGCETDLGRDLGAQLVVTGLVQKFSSLILNIRIIVRDVQSGEFVRIGIADIRSDTDETWTRGVSYLVRNRLLDPPLVVKTPP